MTSDSPPRRLLDRSATIIGAALAGLVVVASLTIAPPSGAVALEAGSKRRADDPQVLVVSLDGLDPDAMRRLGRTGAPGLWRLFDEGAGTLNARTQVELTVTLPNHTSMVTGRRIDRRRGGHGVTWNDDRRTPRTVQRAARHRVASVFTTVDAAGGSTALYAAKSKFALWRRSWPGAIDRFVIREENDAAVVAAARADLIRNDRALTFLHLGDADRAGHDSGWMSPAYLRAVRRLDRLVGLLLTDADSRAALADLTIILTSDHGGVPGTTSHSAPRQRANYTIPFVVWGPGIERADLYRINPGYHDPGRGRPLLAGKQPVRNGDVANLALQLLGGKPVPGSLWGTTRPLRVVG